MIDYVHYAEWVHCYGPCIELYGELNTPCRNDFQWIIPSEYVLPPLGDETVLLLLQC